jgi:hypothetical protein
MKKLVLGLVALALLVALARPVAAHPVVSFGFGFGLPRAVPAPLYYYPAPYPYAPPPYYYPPAPYYPYPYGGYVYPPATVGGYYPSQPYFAGRDEGIRSYTFPGYRDWYSR